MRVLFPKYPGTRHVRRMRTRAAQGHTSKSLRYATGELAHSAELFFVFFSSRQTDLPIIGTQETRFLNLMFLLFIFLLRCIEVFYVSDSRCLEPVLRRLAPLKHASFSGPLVWYRGRRN